MATVRDEYDRFLQWLRTTSATEDVRRLATIVGANLDVLIPATTSGGRRAIVLAPILRANLPNTAPEINVNAIGTGERLSAWRRLHSLKIGPFRGFQYNQEFEFKKRISLIYGPNGSGKTSVCEALEFCLLGSVEEAAAKRIQNVEDYLRNIHAGRYEVPELRVANGGGGAEVPPNADLYRFCFIEKNRIDGFSRIAARTPSQAEDLIAILFGLEAFSAFVGNFTQTIDSQLRLDNPLAREIEGRRGNISAAMEIVASERRALGEVARLQEETAAEYSDRTNYESLLALVGSSERPARLQELDRLLTVPIPAPSGANLAAIRKLRLELRSKVVEIVRLAEKLASKAAQVSFHDLFNALLPLAEESRNYCPACNTPIDSVVENPYARARRGLESLSDLAALQSEHDIAIRERNSTLQLLRIHIAIIEKSDSRARAALDWVTSFLDSIEGPEAAGKISTDDRLLVQAWRGLVRSGRSLEKRDRAVRRRLENREALIVERDLLRTFADRVAALEAQRELLVSQVAAARVRIADFDSENAELLDRVELERATIASEERIRAAYLQYLRCINEYLDGLPRALLSDLNETTCELYNSFNERDHISDKLASVTLPMRGGEKIFIEFQGDPGRRFDALAVLSEGHIRCLGLAILLAKNIRLRLPLIVFDDAVNAIDHEHREGIRETLLNDDRFGDTHLLITCHSNEFIKEFQNCAGHDSTDLYIIRPHDGGHQPRVLGGTTRNYLGRAAIAMDELDLRSALAHCRQALEHLTWRSWKRLIKKGCGELLVTLSAFDAAPELRELVSQLAKRYYELEGNDPGNATRWREFTGAFNDLLGIPATNLAWRYLNKGTHDESERDDFEEPIVRRVIVSLRRIEAALKI